MLFPAQNKLPHICIQLKDTYFSSKLDMGAEVNMLLGFGCLGIIVRNVESIFLFDYVIFPSSLGCLASSFRFLQKKKVNFILLQNIYITYWCGIKFCQTEFANEVT